VPQVEWIADLIRDARAGGCTVIETSQEAERTWTQTCREIADATLFPKTDSWIFGANIPGKKHAVMFYMAGIGAYRGQLEEVRASDYRGFTLDAA